MFENTTKKFFIVKNGDKFGPYSLSDLQGVNVDKETLIWYNGLENWVKIGEVEELAQIFIQVPPPIPKLIVDAPQKVIIESPIDISLLNKNRLSKEEKNEKKRNTTKFFLRELAYILFFVTTSSIVGLLFSYTFSQINKPVLVSDENQDRFNEEFFKRERENQSYMAFGDIMSKYLGYYKYDDEINLPSGFCNINMVRLAILKFKAEDYGWYCFYILFGILLIVRYLSMFIKWLNPSNSTPKLIEDKNLLEK